MARLDTEADYEKGEKMEEMVMKLKIKPFKTKKMNKKTTLLLIEELKNAPSTPLEKLNSDARWLEKTILQRRASAVSKL